MPSCLRSLCLCPGSSAKNLLIIRRFKRPLHQQTCECTIAILNCFQNCITHLKWMLFSVRVECMTFKRKTCLQYEHAHIVFSTANMADGFILHQRGALRICLTLLSTSLLYLEIGKIMKTIYSSNLMLTNLEAVASY